jgi:hypothetical protein
MLQVSDILLALRRAQLTRAEGRVVSALLGETIRDDTGHLVAPCSITATALVAKSTPVRVRDVVGLLIVAKLFDYVPAGRDGGWIAWNDTSRWER